VRMGRMKRWEGRKEMVGREGREGKRGEGGKEGKGGMPILPSNNFSQCQGRINTDLCIYSLTELFQIVFEFITVCVRRGHIFPISVLFLRV
jgi:hypothetical protein